MMAAASYYQLLVTVSFTLLGLWFTVLGIAHGGWRDDPVRHRATLHIALLLLLPGVTGLASVLGGADTLVWRVAFVLGGLVGVVEAVGFLRAGHRPAGALERVLRAVAPLLYALVVAAALVTVPVGDLVPLQVEGFATGLVFLAGIVHLWLVYAETPARHGPPPGRPPQPPPAPGVPVAGSPPQRRGGAG
jgi:hypothetical protein